MLTFILPEERCRRDVLDFYREIQEAGGECIGCGNAGDFDLWLTGMQNRRTGRNLPEGYVRENFYLCCDGGELIGVFSLKFALTDFLLNYGGHIGYAVRPSRRMEGLGTRILAQGLDIAREFGFDKVLCICDEDNAGSEKIIRKNGGVLEDERFDPDENVTVRRFWITL